MHQTAGRKVEDRHQLLKIRRELKAVSSTVCSVRQSHHVGTNLIALLAHAVLSIKTLKDSQHEIDYLVKYMQTLAH